MVQDKNGSRRKVDAEPTSHKQTGATRPRAKGIDELPQRRGLRRSQALGPPRDAIAAVRNFTVGSVGHNGKIYLRYIYISSEVEVGGPF